MFFWGTEMNSIDYVPDINDSRYCKQYDDFYDKEEETNDDEYYDKCYEETLEEIRYHIM